MLTLAATLMTVLLLVTSAGAQVACGDTLTESVQLTADLECTGTRGLIVGADKITIDLNGFKLFGDGDVGDVGIDNGLGFDGVTIKNGTVSEFDECISIGGNAQKNVVTNVIVSFALNDAIDLNDSDFTKISKSTLLNNGAGVQIGTDATGNVVEKSFILGSAGAGVQILGADNLVQKNQFTVNEDGVRVLGGGNRVLSNNVHRSEHDGIAIEGGTGNEVAKNTLVGNRNDGIEVRNAPGTIVTKNVSSGNRQNGIHVFGTSDGTVVQKRTASGSEADGIVVENDTANARVEGNTAVGNRLNGVFIQSTTTTAAKNSATANLSFGVRANTVAIDGGGNKASANADGDCFFFVCN